VPFDPTPGRSLPTQASSSSDIAPAASAKPQSSATPALPGTSGAPSPGGTSRRSVAQRATGLGDGFGWLAALGGALALLAATCLATLRSAGWRSRIRGSRVEVGAARARLASRARRRGLDLPPGVTNGELADALAERLEIDARAWARAADCAAYAPGDQAGQILPAFRAETRRLGKAIRSTRRVTLPG
jgi:hypothetical protein